MKYGLRMQLGLRIQELKEMDYKEYLQTPEWKEIRNRMFRRSEYTCEQCHTKHTTLNVHHKTYDRIGEEQDDDLVVLCENCHEKLHKK